MTVPGLEFRYVGKQGDGGYVIGLLPQNIQYDALMAYGVCNDVSFEAAFLHGHANTKLQAHLFDHTIQACPAAPPQHAAMQPRLQWHCEGIAPITNAKEKLDTFERQLLKTGNRDATAVFMKMDIEGAEWESLNATTHSVLQQCAQIVMELHDPMKALKDPITFGTWTRLMQDFVLVHVHGNNSKNWRVDEMPRFLEITLIRRNVFAASIQEGIKPRDVPYPVPGLDSRNASTRPESALAYWLAT